ncbi:hypothetical protein H4R26_001718 [Coemansia thaxteri]|uniref:Protein kinase domain-containing protein n=1 Tax=Coemansia thaxteri TaxID=2663907 RepID=A0A9W8BL74_9FUNG|nr:hypothetical protein H4R26_001718 [Coemansia thaxteri]
MYKVTNPDIKYTIAAQVGEDAQGMMVVGQYIVVKELGRGSFGTVYLVKHAVTGELFALKEYHKASLRRRLQSSQMKCARGGGPTRPARGGLFAARQRLQQQQSEEAADPFSLIKTELAISKKLQHPHLVKLHEVLNDSEQDVLYLVIDLCENGPVRILDAEHATSEPLPAETAHKYFTQALLALEYLHEHDIVHRDIKPDNLLLTKDNVLKITDFGESTLNNSGEKTYGSSGTPAFMAPELCQGLSEISGEAADIWSLGVCLYSFIYGALPFQGASVIDVLDSVSAGELRFPGPYDEQLNDLLVRMLERNPDSRITIDEIREHAWVTQNGTFELPSKHANCENAVAAITQEDLDSIIQPIFDIMPVILAVAKLRRFRQRIREKRERLQREAQQRNEQDSGGLVDQSQPQAE